MTEPIFCPEHGNFPNKEAFAEHVAKVHPEMVAGQDIINKVNKEVEAQKNKVVPPAPAPTPPTTPPPPEAPKTATPIELKYQFSGQCSLCFTSVDTIMLDVKEDVFAIAYCQNCKKTLQQQKVRKLGGEHGTNEPEARLPLLQEVRNVSPSKKKPV